MLRTKSFNLLFLFILIFYVHNLYALKEFSISAIFETPQVKFNGNADDPAIWLNKNDPNLSIIFGTDKYNGIYSYNLKGETIGFSNAGSINNIDLRTHNDMTYIFGTDSANNNINVWVYKNSYLHQKSMEGDFSIDEEPHFFDKVNFLAYGVCGGLINNKEIIVFVTEAKGPRVKLWKFSNNNLEIMNTFNNSNASESEGCVFDDENNKLFISEENERGVIRSYSLSKDLLLTNKINIDDRSGNVIGDPEGLALLKTTSNDGYLIASSQGNSTFNIYDRNKPHKFVGSFKIIQNSFIDGVTDTDGLEIVNTYLNDDFPNGLLVVQDGKNTGENTLPKENFKLLSLSEIKKYLIYQEN